MRNRILLLAALLMPGMAAWGQNDPEEQPFGIGLETGGVWFSRNDVRIPSETGTEFDMTKLTGSGPAFFARLDDAIREEMNQSDLIVFLLSPEFLATDYVMKVEVPLALEKFGPSKKLFFIQLLPCHWDKTDLFRFQQTSNATETEKNIITVGTPDNDAKWKEVVDELLKKIKAN